MYPVVHNTKAGAYLRSLLENMNNQVEGKQMEGLLHEIKQLSEKSERQVNDLR